MKIRMPAVMISSSLLLAACGLAETAATGAATGASAAEQAKEGRKIQEGVKEDIATMQQQSKDALAAAEAESLGE